MKKKTRYRVVPTQNLSFRAARGSASATTRWCLVWPTLLTSAQRSCSAADDDDDADAADAADTAAAVDEDDDVDAGG